MISMSSTTPILQGRIANHKLSVVVHGGFVIMFVQYKAMLEWRDRMKVDKVLDTWIPKYPIIKECSPHFNYGVTRTGIRVNYELHGGLDPGKMKSQGLCREDIERQIAFLHEFTEKIWGSHDPRMITVMDMKGLSIRKASNPFMLSLTRWYSETIETYYPGTVRRILIINPPFGIGVIVKIMSVVLPASFCAKLEILYDLKKLQDYIDPSQIPVQYGGTCTTPLQDSPYEKRMREFQASVSRNIA